MPYYVDVTGPRFTKVYLVSLMDDVKRIKAYHQKRGRVVDYGHIATAADLAYLQGRR